jgi:hypothetical protein
MYDVDEELFDSIFNPFHDPNLWKQLIEGKVKNPDEYFEDLRKKQLLFKKWFDQ